MVQGMKNIPAISKYLTNQMRVPANQIMHLSDAAKDNPTPPTKSVVESTITEFLKSSRKLPVPTSPSRYCVDIFSTLITILPILIYLSVKLYH